MQNVRKPIFDGIKMGFFDGKVIVLTGGGGTLGLHLAEELLKNYKPSAVRLLDNNEEALFWAEQKLVGFKGARYFLGDIRDKPRLLLAFEGADIVFHTAALKHVHISEYSPFEALKTNVLGTENCVEAALEKGVKVFVHLSSDKSVEARGTYGVSKLLSERLVLDARRYRGDRPTKFVIVRPANFFKSSGSVMEIWEKQLKEGKPLSVTHPKMERYFMTIEEIVQLVLYATEKGEDGQILIPANAKLYKIIDLAKSMSDNIQVTGVRVGEVLKQKLMLPEEKVRARLNRIKNIWIIPPEKIRSEET